MKEVSVPEKCEGADADSEAQKWNADSNVSNYLQRKLLLSGRCFYSTYINQDGKAGEMSAWAFCVAYVERCYLATISAPSTLFIAAQK